MRAAGAAGAGGGVQCFDPDGAQRRCWRRQHVGPLPIVCIWLSHVAHLEGSLARPAVVIGQSDLPLHENLPRRRPPHAVSMRHSTVVIVRGAAVDAAVPLRQQRMADPPKAQPSYLRPSQCQWANDALAPLTGTRDCRSARKMTRCSTILTTLLFCHPQLVYYCGSDDAFEWTCCRRIESSRCDA